MSHKAQCCTKGTRGMSHNFRRNFRVCVSITEVPVTKLFVCLLLQYPILFSDVKISYFWKFRNMFLRGQMVLLLQEKKCFRLRSQVTFQGHFGNCLVFQCFHDGKMLSSLCGKFLI